MLFRSVSVVFRIVVGNCGIRFVSKYVLNNGRVRLIERVMYVM